MYKTFEVGIIPSIGLLIVLLIISELPIRHLKGLRFMTAEVDNTIYINPVIAGLEEAFNVQLNCKIERTGLGLMENNQALYPVSGIIGISGKAVGTVVLSMSESVAIKAAATMLLDPNLAEINDDVMDAVGEITNIVCGAAKAKLAQFQLSISLPNVLCGANCRLHFPQNSHPIFIPFKCAWGFLALQIGFALSSNKTL
ncbi:MAG: chemotaxis protein CheX [Planctomycetaceae bacterium]|nr:chemotaxis protein CheX [Planctomycetaceae bacterium]